MRYWYKNGVLFAFLLGNMQMHLAACVVYTRHVCTYFILDIDDDLKSKYSQSCGMKFILFSNLASGFFSSYKLIVTSLYHQYK